MSLRKRKRFVGHDSIGEVQLTRNNNNTSNLGEQTGQDFCQKEQWKQGPINPVVLEEGSHYHMIGLKPRHREMHTFCRKMSEDTIDKERIIVGIGWVLGTAGRVGLKTLKLLFSFPYKRLHPLQGTPV